MPTAYAFFDESGTHDDSPVLCVAGYLFTEEHLEEFNEQWNALLEARGLKYFHMVDCAHGSADFKRLTKDDRIDLQTSLIELIKAKASRGVGAMVQDSVYSQLMPHHPNLGSAYNYCIWHCLEAARLWLDEQDLHFDIKYHFEQGHKSDREANRIMNLAFDSPEGRPPFGYLGHWFLDKSAFPGVQAADLLAWQMFTDWRHGMERRPRRKDFASLISDGKHRVCVIDDKRILYHVDRMKEAGAWTKEGLGRSC